MARNSIATAKAEVFALLANSSGTPVASLTQVTRCTDYEPKAGDLSLPVAVTVATHSMSPDWYKFRVRVYASVVADAQQAQYDLDATIMAVDALLFTYSHGGPSDWTIDYIPELASFVASNVLEVGREDI